MAKAPPTPPTPVDAVDRKAATIAVELDIIVFTLLINLGFLKITEVSTFIGQITNSVHNLNLLQITIIGSAVLAYMIYAGSILFGLVAAFKGRNTRPAMVWALGAFFAMYAAVFFNAVGHAQINAGGPQDGNENRAAPTPG